MLKYLSTQELMDRYGKSRTTIWNWQQKRGFPKPLSFSTPSSAFYDPEAVEAWEKQNDAEHLKVGAA